MEDYAGMNKSMLWEDFFYNYEQCNKIVENIDAMQYVLHFLYHYWRLCKMLWK